MEGRMRCSISWVGLAKGNRRKGMMLSPVENFRNQFRGVAGLLLKS